MTELEETIKLKRKWEQRLMVPLAKKLGYSGMEALRKDMYKNNSNGDWQLFADRAVKKKWVGNVVQEIRETGILKKPTKEPKPFSFWTTSGLTEKRDTAGKRYVELPRLDPFDAYFMYDPDDYYR